MKTKLLFVFGSTLGLAVLLLLGLSADRSGMTAADQKQLTDAAYRDGLFQAKLDVQSGRQPHIASSRWSTSADRALYVAGYMRGYREFSQAHSGKLAESREAELTGYRDGMLDGAGHRQAAQPFQLDKTDNYRNGGQRHLESTADSEQYKQNYRRGYSNGYQQGYYTGQDHPELRVIGATSPKF